MKESPVNYRGFAITPIAAKDGALYAAMTIIRDPDGIQHASGMLEQFQSADEARRFALSRAKREIDHCLMVKMFTH